jgi:hypothetical protein
MMAMGEWNAAGTQPFLKACILPLQAVLVCHFCYIVMCSMYCTSHCKLFRMAEKWKKIVTTIKQTLELLAKFEKGKLMTKLN